MHLKKNRSLTLFGTILFLLSHTLSSQIDTHPKPYGGKQLMREFICDEMIYPESAIKSKTEGTVKIGLTVLQDGKKANYRVIESVSAELDKEALRICRLIMFYPAVVSSNYIIANVEIPVKFNIKKYKRNCKQKGFNNLTAFSGTIDTSMIVYASRSLDKMPVPVFKDPSMTFGKYIMENMKYPENAYTQNIEGIVELSFVVETSGRISNIEVLNSLGGGCTEEAIQLLKRIHWKPGLHNDIAVRSFLTASINFNLSNNSGHRYLPNHNNTTM